MSILTQWAVRTQAVGKILERQPCPVRNLGRRPTQAGNGISVGTDGVSVVPEPVETRAADL